MSETTIREQESFPTEESPIECPSCEKEVTEENLDLAEQVVDDNLKLQYFLNCPECEEQSEGTALVDISENWQ